MYNLLSLFYNSLYYDYFKNIYKCDCVYGSFLGVDLNKYKNINDFSKREKSVVIPYYKSKSNRLPDLVGKIINILSTNNIKCYVFPDNYNNSNNFIINLGTLNETQLCDLYNNSKVGIIFSNSNPSRLGYEMYACGLNVIEYECEFTEYDMPREFFTKIKNEDNITEIVNQLFNKEPNTDFLSEINIEQDYTNFYNFIMN